MNHCPACHATYDYHPDPGGPAGETWWVCENCGYTRDHTDTVIDPGRPRLDNQDDQDAV